MTRAKFMWNACTKAEKPMKKKTWQRQVRGRVAQQFSPKYGTSAQAKEYQKKQARKWMKDWREVPANAEKIRKLSKKRMVEMRKKTRGVQGLSGQSGKETQGRNAARQRVQGQEAAEKDDPVSPRVQ